MTRLFRAVFRELLPLYLAGLLIFVTLKLVDDISTLAAHFMHPSATPQAVAYLLGLLTPSRIELALVVAVPFAALMVLGRLARDSEIKALLALGVSPLRLIAPMALLGLIISLLGVVNSVSLVPKGEAQFWRYFHEGIYNIPEPAPNQSNYVYMANGTLYHAGSVQRQEDGRAQLLGVLVSRPGQTYSALFGTWDAREQTWELRGPWLTEGGSAPRQLEGTVLLPQDDRLRPPIPAEKFELRRTSMSELTAMLADPAIGEVAARGLRFEQYRRFTDPLAAFGLAIAAGALGLLIPGRAWAFGALLSLVFGFYVAWTAMPELVRNGALAPALGALLPLGLLLALAAVLLRRVA